MKPLLIALVCALGSLTSARAATIALWTFETPNVPPTVMGNTITGLLPALGTGDASGYHSNTLSGWSSQLGNGSANALNATAWSLGDYWQFHTTSLGYDHLQLSWDQAAGTGPSAVTNFSLFYSTDGQHFTVGLSHYQVYRNDPAPTSAGGGGGVWNTTTRNPNYTVSLDLSGIAALQNASNVYFQLQPSFQGSDYVRIDNFSVSGIAVPEPSGLLWLGLPALLFASRRR